VSQPHDKYGGFISKCHHMSSQTGVESIVILMLAGIWGPFHGVVGEKSPMIDGLAYLP
jgi:hypothetical protein